MSEEQYRKGTQTLPTGILIIIWITALFMVMIINDIKQSLEQINSKMGTAACATASQSHDPSNAESIDSHRRYLHGPSVALSSET